MSDDLAVKRARAALLEAEISAAEASRAAAAPPPPGDPAAAVPAQVAQLGAELAAGTTPGTPPGELPAGIMSLEELQRQDREGGSSRPGMSYAERMKANDAFCASYEYHAKNGAI